MIKNLNKKILVGITGRNSKEWKEKLEELNKLKIKKAALFLEWYKKSEREKIYEALLKSSIKNIPLVHIRNDMKKEELKFLAKEFQTKCFTIHENSFQNLDNWEGFYQKLFLEMNKDDSISNLVKMQKIGGFCVDLSHFKSAEDKNTKEFYFTLSRKNTKKYFVCNHLNGYVSKKKTDKHTIEKLSDFDYLKTLPKFVFGKYIALETFNSIEEQVKFKKYLVKILS